MAMVESRVGLLVMPDHATALAVPTDSADWLVHTGVPAPADVSTCPDVPAAVNPVVAGAD